MGDPRHLSAKWARPGHPWQRSRIEEERILSNEFGLKSRRELWKARSMLKTFAGHAKRLIALRTDQAELERKQLLDRIARLGLLAPNSKLDDVLALSIRDLLNRRLQTLVFRKGLARTPTQARQMIVHEHITIGNKTVSAPSYLVPVDEETSLAFVGSSSFSNPQHPERTIAPKPKAAIAKDAANQKRDQKPRRRERKFEKRSKGAA